MMSFVSHNGSVRKRLPNKRTNNIMKNIASAFIGLSLLIGTAMAQAPATSTSTTPDNGKSTTTTTTKKKHAKKHNAAKPAASTTPATPSTTAPAK
jgi:hypothetical protein